MGSESGASTVTTYLQNNGGTSIVLSKNMVMNIQTLLPAFDVIHQCLCFIKLYQNTMTLL